VKECLPEQVIGFLLLLLERDQCWPRAMGTPCASIPPTGAALLPCIAQPEFLCLLLGLGATVIHTASASASSASAAEQLKRKD
jgi:hypothetical protein